MFMLGSVDLTERSSANFFHELVLEFGVAIFFDHDHVLVQKDGFFLDDRSLCFDAFDSHNTKNIYYQM